MGLKIDVNRMQPGPISRLMKRYSDVGLALVLILVLMLLVLPIPSMVLDLAIALNFSFSMILLASAIHLKSALELAAFPSLLLLTTLFRLGLAVATTKMILLHAHAGDIIHTFGNLVVGGNIVVGLVIFVLLCAVQFIVVAKGGDRVAEVGARFTLDAIPGRQMSIDADLRAGSIGRDEAKARRKALEQGIEFYGAMDGAMKFVKGDAIIGVLIAIVNIVGGIAIGMIYRGMTIAEALQTYTVLTVGDGLVSQIPSLIVSITAGLIITRGDTSGKDGHDGSDGHLGGSIFDQLGVKYRPLLMAAVAVFLMACIPGFPHVQFLVIAAVLATLAWAARAQGRDEAGVESVTLRNLTRDGATYDVGLFDVVEMGTTAPLAVRVGEEAVAAIDPGGFDQALGEMRQDLMRELGLPFPGIAVRVDPECAADGYAIDINGTTVARGQLLPGQVFVPQGAQDGRFRHEDDGNDDAASKGVWVDPAELAGADHLQVLYPNDVLVRHLHRVCRRSGAAFVGTQEVAFLVDRLSILFPHLVDSLRDTVSVSVLAGTLRRLLDEGVSVRNLRGIVEAIVSAGGQARIEELAVRVVRVALRRQIVTALSDTSTGKLACLLLHPELDAVLVRAVEVLPSGESRFTLDAQVMTELTQTIGQARVQWGDDVVVLTGPLVRMHLADFIRQVGWGAKVLAMDELDVAVVPLDPLGVLALGQAHAAGLVPQGPQGHG